MRKERSLEGFAVPTTGNKVFALRPYYLKVPLPHPSPKGGAISPPNLDEPPTESLQILSGVFLPACLGQRGQGIRASRSYYYKSPTPDPPPRRGGGCARLKLPASPAGGGGTENNMSEANTLFSRVEPEGISKPASVSGRKLIRAFLPKCVRQFPLLEEGVRGRCLK